MKRSDKKQKCFVPPGSGVRLCNCVDLYGDGTLWETQSGKWIPVPLKTENTPVITGVSPVVIT